MSATTVLTAQRSGDLDPLIEDFLQRLISPRCYRLTFIKLDLLWHILGEFYTPATLGELVLDIFHDLEDTQQALKELCAAGFVRHISQEGKLTRYALTEDRDLQGLVRNFFTVYHRSDQVTLRIIARMAGETFTGFTRHNA